MVSAVQESGATVKEYQPTALLEHICSESTLRQLQECLKGVCKDPEGTAHGLFQHSFFPVAGKTGTALVADGKHGYADHVYQSSFVGYFPADHPKYTCIVVIKNHPFAKNYLGAKVAGPVFKELADKLMSLDPDIAAPIPTDSAVTHNSQVTKPQPIITSGIPNVKGMGLMDALYTLESMDLKVAVRGRGKVRMQSPEPGSGIKKNETITLQLD
jgi:cell division protein FtsI (penicillin-binding protein 3)